jgi:hypothetical protein
MQNRVIVINRFPVTIDYRIEHLNLGDIFIKDKAELSNFAFQCYLDGEYIRVRRGTIYYNNSILHWLDPDPRHLDENDDRVIKVGSEFASIAVKVPYLIHDKGRDAPNPVTILGVSRPSLNDDLRQQFGNGDSLYYIIADVDQNGGITQRQFGDIRDRNIPDLFNWPNMGSYEYEYNSEDDSYSIVPVNPQLAFDVFQRADGNSDTPFTISTLRAQ